MDVLNKELLSAKTILIETERMKHHRQTEVEQLQEKCRQELDQSKSATIDNEALIVNYKQICTQLSERLDKQQSEHKEELGKIKVKKIS